MLESEIRDGAAAYYLQSNRSPFHVTGFSSKTNLRFEISPSGESSCMGEA
jgi:hypothetical protein